MQKPCETCGGSFEAARAAAKYCGDRCRKRAQRSGRTARPVTGTTDDPVAGADSPEPELVMQVRRELDEARALDTVLGQLTLQLALRVAGAPAAETGFSTLVKEFRATRAEALGKTAPESDPLDEMKERRDAKARAAAASS